MLVLWLATRVVAPWPASMHAPLLWPGVFAAALLAWSQALTWMPYGLGGLRVVVAVLWLVTIDSIALLALHFHAHEAVMLAIAAPQIPIAYLVARTAVGRSRRGDVPDWSGALGKVLRRGRSRATPAAFRSMADAQRWFEFRRHGRSLPAIVALLLPFELALLWLARDAAPLVFDILGLVLFTPPIMATFAAANVRGGGSSPGASAFITTKPVTSEALVRATLRAAARGTAITWLLVAVAVPVALLWSGTAWMVSRDVARMWRFVGAPRTTAVMLVTTLVLVLTTWRLLVQGLYIGWSGRPWLRKGSVFLALVLLIAVGPLAHWIGARPHAIAALWRAIPASLAVLALVKLCAGAWVVTRIHRDQLVRDRTLVAGAACWCAAVLTLHGALVWTMDTHFFPHYVLAYLAILAVPLVRVAAGPLALHWSRHR